MNISNLLLLIAAFGIFSGATTAGRSDINVIGWVSKPGAYAQNGDVATLSSLLESAGGILKNGSDRISITGSAPDGQKMTMSLKGSELYSSEIDYIVPQGSIVCVFECVGLGFGNLSELEFLELERKRSIYIRKANEGKIQKVELFKIQNEANK